MLHGSEPRRCSRPPCRRAILVGAVALAAFASACSPKPAAKLAYFASCSTQSDCESGTCSQSVCTHACLGNGECGTGVCLQQACVPLSRVGCAADSECSSLFDRSDCATASCNAGHCQAKAVAADFVCAVACEAGKAITGACVAGKCAAKPGADPVSCADTNPCTSDLCVTNQGCQNSPIAAGCTDDNACTVSDLCVDGTCVPGKGKLCDDANACTTDSCDPVGGCKNTATAQAPCDDGNGCTEKDACSISGVCTGTAVVCAAAALCKVNPCLLGKCTTGDAAATVACNDGNVCSAADTCDGKGSCAGKAIKCDDNKPCTTDACDKVTGCSHTANANACDDGNACTTSDTCAGGACAGKAIDCSAAAGICAIGVCAAGLCAPQLVAVGTACDDGAKCTSADSCQAGGTCAGKTVVCDDGDPCSQDSCAPATGQCVAAPISDGSSCGAGLACISKLASDPELLGRWTLDGCDGADSSPMTNHGAVKGTVKCVDGVSGKALELGGTGYVEVPNTASMKYAGTAISYGGWVKLSEPGAYTVILGREKAFLAGVRPEGLISAVFLAAPSFAAWLGTAEVSVGSWHHVTVVYDGALVRNYVDGIAATTYPMSGAIADSSCLFAIGARTVGCGQASALFKGAVDDMFLFARALTAAEVFALAGKGWAGGCAPAPLPCSASPECDDKDPCTSDTCTSGACGHAAAANDTPCDDGSKCTPVDACQAGVCVGANSKVCAVDQSACHVNTCAKYEGLCFGWPKPAGEICGDGLACLAEACTKTVCGDGTCSGGESAPSCPSDCGASFPHLAGPCNLPGGKSQCGDGYVCVLRSAAGGGPVCVADFDSWAPLPDAHSASDFTEFTDYVVDKRTGLQWAKQAQASAAWAVALAGCATQTYGGSSDWRVPTRAELNSLFDLTVQNPATSAPNLLAPEDGWEYWTSMPLPFAVFAWRASLATGETYFANKDNVSRIRCVR